MEHKTLEGNIPGRGYARVEFEKGRICQVTVLGGEEAGRPILSPGLVDIQVNGFAGVDFASSTLEPEEAVSVLAPLFATGVTGFCPTLVTNSLERFVHSLQVLEAARRMSPEFDRAVPCYHLEGPFLDPGGAHGAHDPSLMLPADWEVFARLQEAANGNIGIVTIAPEVEGALDFIARARAAGVVVALGHTVASPERIHEAVTAGATLSTHLGNGCPGMIDRHFNPLWAQLTEDALYASIICDTFHLPPDVVQVIRRMKGIDHTILITDSTHVATLPPGRYKLVNTDIELLPNGKLIRADGACLGGSVLSMDRAVPLFMRLSGATLAEALRAATASPARLLNRRDICASLAPGEPANLLVSQFGADQLAVESLYLGGEAVYSTRS